MLNLHICQFIASQQHRPSPHEHQTTATMFTLRTALFALASAVAVSADYYIDPTSVDLLTRSMLGYMAENRGDGLGLTRPL